MTIINEDTRIEGNAKVGPGLFMLEVSAPGIAGSILPGQFVHMKVPNMDGHILRRPFSVFAKDDARGTMEILYQVVGYGTDKMTLLEPGDHAEMIGPVGRCWSPADDVRKALLVGGGVGAAPLFMLAEQLVADGVETHVVLGASTADTLVCRPRYDGLACERFAFATDDGTLGRSGFCTSLAEEAIEEVANSGKPFDYAAVCGPEPLMKIVSKMALDAGIPCQVSMEKRMACGIGACLSCVVETSDGKKRACVDGPIFDAEEIVW